MCKVYNSVGSLTTIKNRLHLHNINEFNSINDLISFRKEYSTLRQQIISQQESLIAQEKVTLASEILQLESSIDARKKACEREFRNEVRHLKQELFALSATPANIFQI